MISITITGFKTMEEAEAWITSYSEGVEQDMANWSECSKDEHPSGYKFPWCSEMSKIKENNIILPLTHPDTYIET